MNTRGFIGVDAKSGVFYVYNTEAMLIGYIGEGEIMVDLKPEPNVNIVHVE